jgi:hypothetical protein
MPPSYLIAVITASKQVEVLLAVLNIAGKGRAFLGMSDGTVNTDLWIIPKGRRNKEEVLAQLRATPAIDSVAVVALSNPVHNEELGEVRELFSQIGWNSSDIADEALSLFLNDKLRDEYSYYIDFDPRERVPRKIRIKRFEDHPDYSPDSLKATPQGEETDPDKQYTIDDISVSSVTLKPIKRRRRSQPPPPDNEQQQKNEGEKNSLL